MKGETTPDLLGVVLPKVDGWMGRRPAETIVLFLSSGNAVDKQIYASPFGINTCLPLRLEKRTITRAYMPGIPDSQVNYCLRQGRGQEDDACHKCHNSIQVAFAPSYVTARPGYTNPYFKLFCHKY